MKPANNAESVTQVAELVRDKAPAEVPEPVLEAPGRTGMVVEGKPTPPGPMLIVSLPTTIVVGLAPIP